jgi:ABC-type lipoprotein release transport system permease subunit
MKLLLKLAWRNMFRNKRRTFLTAIAIGVGLASMIFFDAYMIGTLNNVVHSAIASFPGQVQIHRKDFTKTYDVEKIIMDGRKVMDTLQTEKTVDVFAPRTMSYAMITSASDVASAMLYGIQLEKEEKLSQLKQAITSGDFWSLNDKETNRVLIGQKLAESLNIGIGDRVVVTVAQANTGELSQEMFRIGGIFSVGISEMDAGAIFVELKKSQDLLYIGDNIHELALNFKDIKLASDDKLGFWDKYSKNDNEALSWEKIFPDIQAMVEMTYFSMYIIGLILFGIVAIGIMNTLFMSLYERMFEFGVLRAIGTRPFNMFMLVIFEAGFLAIISIVIGIILGFAVSYIFSITGIDYRGLEFVGVTIQEMIYPVLKYEQYIVYPVWLFVFTVIIAIYPAVFAAKITPSKAMKRGN